MATRSPQPRYAPEPRVVSLVERYGATRVGIAYALDGDAMRRYLDGASQRMTRWWIELHAEKVTRELAESEKRPPLRVCASSDRGGKK